MAGGVPASDHWGVRGPTAPYPREACIRVRRWVFHHGVAGPVPMDAQAAGAGVLARPGQRVGSNEKITDGAAEEGASRGAQRRTYGIDDWRHRTGLRGG